MNSMHNWIVNINFSSTPFTILRGRQKHDSFWSEFVRSLITDQLNPKNFERPSKFECPSWRSSGVDHSTDVQKWRHDTQEYDVTDEPVCHRHVTLLVW